MKAITIWQPWASLKACGAKEFETRSWATSYRGPIAIHSAAMSPFKAIHGIKDETINAMEKTLREAEILPEYGDFRYLPLGAVIATGELVNIWRIVAHPGTNVDIAKNILIGAESLATDKHAPDSSDYFVPTAREIMFGDWTPGRYAWKITNVRMLPESIPAKGKQGLWDWDNEIYEKRQTA